MEDNKELMNEQTTIEAAEVTPVNGTAEIRTERVTAKPVNTDKWGSGAVTKKFMTIALAATILINAGVTAGVMSLTAKHTGHDRPDIQTGSRPGTEMFSDNGSGSNGQMTPPQSGQMTPPQNRQMTPPADVQNNTQDQSANQSDNNS